MVLELPAPLPLERRDKLTAAILAAVALAAGYWWMVGGICGIYHDDAIYAATAKALAEGQGYRLINLPGAPFQTKFPILYPAVLAFIWKLRPVFPDNLWVMQALSLLAGGAVTGLAYLYLVRFGYFTRTVALAAGLLCASSINFLYFATLILSEIPFALLSVAALWALEEQARAPRENVRRQILLGILLGLPFLCRTIGISLVPAGLFVLYRQRLPFRRVAGGASVVIFSWFLWILLSKIYFSEDQVTGYYTNYLSWWYATGISFFAQVLFTNLFSLMIYTGSIGIPGANSVLSPIGAWVNVPYFILGMITWIIIVKNACKWQILPFYLLSYLVIVLIWPWPPFRFLVSVLPFLLAYLIYGASAIKQRLTLIPGRRIVFVFMIGILVAANLGLVFQRGRVHLETRYPNIICPHPPVSWSSYEAVFNWVRRHTSPDDIIASGFDTMIYLYTGRRAFRPFVGRPASLFYGDEPQALGNPEDLLRVLKAYRARYLIQTPMPDFAEEKPFAELLKKLIRQYPGVLQPVFIGRDDRFVIFAVGPD